MSRIIGALRYAWSLLSTSVQAHWKGLGVAGVLALIPTGLKFLAAFRKEWHEGTKAKREATALNRRQVVESVKSKIMGLMPAVHLSEWKIASAVGHPLDVILEALNQLEKEGQIHRGGTGWNLTPKPKDNIWS